MRFVAKGASDLPTGSIVEEPLEHPRVPPPRQDHCDLSVPPLDLVDVALHLATDVPVGAILDGQWDAQRMRKDGPLAEQTFSLVPVDGDMEGVDVVRINGPGIPKGFHDAAVELTTMITTWWRALGET